MEVPENRRITAIAIISGLLFLVTVSILLILNFMTASNERIVAQNQQYLSDTASQSITNMNDLFESASYNVRLAARLYGLEQEGNVMDREFLKTLTDQTMFSIMRYIDADGIVHTYDGRTGDGSDREYFTEGMKGNSGTCYTESSAITGKRMLLFYAPIRENNKITSVIIGSMDREVLRERMRSSYFGVDANEYLCLRDGTICEAFGDDHIDYNIFEYLDIAGMVTQENLQKLKKAFETGSEAGYSYESSKGVGNVFVAPLKDSDFMLVQTFPSAVGANMMNEANQPVISLGWQLGLLFAIYVACIITIYVRRNRRLARENKDVHQIVDSVKQLYDRFVLFDLEKNTYEYLEGGELDSLHGETNGVLSDWLDRLRQLYAEDADSQDMAKHMTIEGLRESLTRENWLVQREYGAEMNQENRWERISLIKLDMNEKVTNRVLAAIENITELKEDEIAKRNALERAWHEADAANRAKSDFLSRMSHDIRTPMNAIMGFTQLMRNHLDDAEKLRMYLEKVNSASNHLLKIINEILDMSKIEAGKMELANNPFSLANMIDDVVNIINPLTSAKNQKLTIRTENLQHEEVIGDEHHLQQVFINILSNSYKYTGENGHLEITLSELSCDSLGNAQYQFVFEDNGVGMSQEFLQRLFTPFERSEDLRTSKIEGTGLGMAIVKNVIELMNGTIHVESELGVGTKITITVPIRVRVHGANASEPTLEGHRILLVGDDEESCQTISATLLQLHAQVDYAQSLDETVALVQESIQEGRLFSAAVLDFINPETDALHTLRMLRSEECLRDIPIIINAFDTSKVAEANVDRLDVSVLVRKPLFRSRIIRTVENLSNNAEDIAGQAEDSPATEFPGKRILVVEDNLLNREILKSILEPTNALVECAENGKEAVEAFAASDVNHYDIIFMDVQMPIMNGHEASRAIRAMDRKDAHTVPIIAVTANTFNDDVQAALNAGMTEHLAKPIQIDDLFALLNRYLGQ